MKLELYGMPFSNKYNVVKSALLEKNLEFDEISATPSQEKEFLKKSPMGLIPFLRVDQGNYIYESWVILEYLEASFQDTPRLLPTNPIEISICRSISFLINLYIELPARALLSLAFGQPVSDNMIQQAAQDVQKGMKGLQQVIKLNPFIAGEQFTLADCNAFFNLNLVSFLLKQATGKDPMHSIEGLPDYLTMIGERPVFAQCVRNQRQAFAQRQNKR